eukprot:GHVQ01023406.1.p1 GENE.GHVQ01023406.1~~GHVQ01023406.1.p1  ORF type:complete len:353 (-),score=35.00 GHVQ01023406.1:647-1705(-)
MSPSSQTQAPCGSVWSACTRVSRSPSQRHPPDCLLTSSPAMLCPANPRYTRSRSCLSLPQLSGCASDVFSLPAYSSKFSATSCPGYGFHSVFGFTECDENLLEFCLSGNIASYVLHLIRRAAEREVLDRRCAQGTDGGSETEFLSRWLSLASRRNMGRRRAPHRDTQRVELYALQRKPLAISQCVHGAIRKVEPYSTAGVASDRRCGDAPTDERSGLVKHVGVSGGGARHNNEGVSVRMEHNGLLIVSTYRWLWDELQEEARLVLWEMRKRGTRLCPVEILHKNFRAAVGRRGLWSRHGLSIVQFVRLFLKTFLVIGKSLSVKQFGLTEVVDPMKSVVVRYWLAVHGLEQQT